jgi:5-methyltetrahydrofolate--homocysteine methyltransferase
MVLATVKGDVHDIGKNIVSVVLACNGYELIDLGVMTPRERILEAVERERPDVLGLSGLITPSLDEMVLIAREMERRGLSLPLLVGGATTSKAHTAAKIAPEYGGPSMHVLDASRAVGVLSSLLAADGRDQFVEENRAAQEELRRTLSGLSRTRKLLPYDEARARRLALSWDRDGIPAPAFTGRREVAPPALEDLFPLIDWTFFFKVWELKGKHPAILEHPRHGPQARELYEDARAVLARLASEGSITARGVYGFWPAWHEGDDLVLSRDNGVSITFPMLRQQLDPADGKQTLCLADFVPPRDGPAGHVGAFAVTAGIGAEELAASFEDKLDDYNAIMVKALADRLAEAFAEWLHRRARREWGQDDDKLAPEALLAGRYRGIRPAFGYPPCPDHSEKRRLFELLDAPAAGITLTDSCMMVPAASVSGLYFAHPEARYFSVGRIGRDQVESYAGRKGMTAAEVERWLAPNLGYEP